MFQLRYWNSEFLREKCCVWIQLVAETILLRRVTGPFWTIESKNQILPREVLLAEEFGRKGSTLIFVHPCMYRHIYVHVYTCLSMPFLEFFSQLVLALNQIQHFETRHNLFRSSSDPFRFKKGLAWLWVLYRRSCTKHKAEERHHGSLQCLDVKTLAATWFCGQDRAAIKVRTC